MGILVLSNSRGKDIPYSRWLSDLNEEIYFLCSADYDLQNLDYHYKKGFLPYENNEDLIIEAEKLLKNKKINRIIAKAECDLIRGGLLRDKFNVPGQTYDQASAFRNKFKMKSILFSKNIPIAEFCLIDKMESAIEFAEIYGFPLIVKPVDASGSFGTIKINSMEELKNISELNLVNKLLEIFVDGEMYHIVGVVINNEVRFIYPSKYITSCLAYQENQSLKSQLLEFDNPLRDRLIDFTKKVLIAMPTPEHSTFHAEVFHTPDDQLVLCEIASRTGGGRVRKTLNLAFDLDIDEHWIKAQCNIFYPSAYVFPNKPNILIGWILITPRSAILKKFAEGSLPDWVLEYRHVGKEGTSYKNANKSTDCVATFIVKGCSEKEIQERLHYVDK